MGGKLLIASACLGKQTHPCGATGSYLKRAPGQSAEVAPAMMRMGWSPVAALAIAPLQDLLNLGREGRMNMPGRADGNWRCSEEMLSLADFQWLEDLTEDSKRTARPGSPRTTFESEGETEVGGDE